MKCNKTAHKSAGHSKPGRRKIREDRTFRAAVSAYEFDLTYADQPCVYLLFRGRELVYVGSTISPLGRIGSHKAGHDRKQFDRAIGLPVLSFEMLQLEASLIYYLRPTINWGRKKLSLPTQITTRRMMEMAKKYMPYLFSDDEKHRQILPRAIWPLIPVIKEHRLRAEAANPNPTPRLAA